LLHVKGTRQNVRVRQVATNVGSLNAGDSFILDLGMEIIQWNGAKASLFEKMRAGQVVRAMKDERGGNPECYIYSQGDKDKGPLEKFWATLGGNEAQVKDARAGGDDASAAAEADAQVKLYRLSDARGTLSFTLEKTGNIAKSDLDSKDAFILDNGSEVFVWIGKQSSPQERKMGMQYAEQYLGNNNRPPHTPISRVIEGGENQIFELNFTSGELSRDIDFNNLNPSGGRAPCCPHHPEGSHSNQPSSVSNVINQGFGGRKPGQGKSAAGRPVDQGLLQTASNDAFAFFKNNEKMANAATSASAKGSFGLYNF